MTAIAIKNLYFVHCTACMKKISLVDAFADVTVLQKFVFFCFV